MSVSDVRKSRNWLRSLPISPMTLRIYGDIKSGNCQKVKATAEHLGLAYEWIPVDITKGQSRTPEFLALNPNATVPVIVDGGHVLWESNTICRYLSAKHGRADLLPANARARAGVEQWMDWQATDLNASWRYAFLALVRRDPFFQDTRQIETSVAEWNARMGILERRLAVTGAFAAGPDFTLADVVLGLSVNRWLMTPIERPNYPAAAAYFDRLKQRPGFLEHGCNGIP